MVDLKTLLENRRKLEIDEHTFLSVNGWNYTIQTPSNYWLWCKTIDGRQVQCDRRTAIDFVEATLQTQE
jgi:hypothetical protein